MLPIAAILLASFAIAACASQEAVSSDGPELAIVDEIEIRAPQANSENQEIEVWAMGAFADPCTKIDDVTEQHNGNIITMTLTTAPSNREGCENNEIAEFIQIVPIDIEGLSVGEYTVIVNGVSGAFTLNLNERPLQIELTDLFANPEQYNRVNIYTRGAYASGFETSAVAETLRREGEAVYLTEPAVWVEPDAILSKSECFTVELTPPAEFCDVEVQGRFEYGGQYGHLGQYSYQVTAED